MIKTLLYFSGLAIAFILFLIIKTFSFESKQNNKYVVAPALEVSPAALVHLQQAIQCKTISHSDTTQNDTSAFVSFHSLLEKSYPFIHLELRKEIINKYTLLYTWPGVDTTLKPIILMAHMDVVPVENDSKKLWNEDPFGGVLKEGFIWGRGSVDDKINLISMFEATEELLRQGFKPGRTIYFVFGHDEEVGGLKGAKKVADLLLKRNIQADLILDEGGVITTDKIPSMRKPVALLGTAEKGYLTLTLTVEKAGGHSSMPESETAVDILLNALTKVRSSPLPARVTDAQQDFIEYLGPELPFIQKIAFANSWLFEPLIINQYSKTPVGNATMRTTVAPTLLNIGIKENIIPSVAKATINLRLLPGDSISLIIDRLTETIADDRLTISIVNGGEALPTTSVKSFGYRAIEKATKVTFDSTVVTPFLLIGGTDSKHFKEVSESIIRFSPVIDPIGFHGINERVSLDSYKLSIWFYYQLLGDINF